MAQLSGNFILVQPTVLDFNICAFESLYQLVAEVNNSSNVVQIVRIKIPKELEKYLSCSVTNLFLQPNTSQKIVIRFIPR